MIEFEVLPAVGHVHRERLDIHYWANVFVRLSEQLALELVVLTVTVWKRLVGFDVALRRFLLEIRTDLVLAVCGTKCGCA